jgi:REP element-mobilizing transposase RayT
MARSIRIEYEQAYYHVMARGNRREAIFLDEEDRGWFLETLSETCARTGWRVHAFVLMGNHYHLFIETPEPNLVTGMQWLQNTYTRRFNVRHKEWGRLFGDRYKAILTEGTKGYYYETMLDYVHLNPVRARIVDSNKGESVMDYRWSSVALGYALPPSKRAKWLACAQGLDAFGFADTATGRRKMVERLDRRAVEEDSERCGVPVVPEQIDARCSHLRRGWYWGTQDFRERTLALAQKVISKPRSPAYRSAPEHRAHGLEQAHQLLREGLQRAELLEQDLARLKSSDPRKLALALLIRKKTSASNIWLAEHLHLKSAANVSQRLRRIQMKRLKTGLSRKMLAFLDSKAFDI